MALGDALRLVMEHQLDGIVGENVGEPSAFGFMRLKLEASQCKLVEAQEKCAQVCHSGRSTAGRTSHVHTSVCRGNCRNEAETLSHLN